MKILTSSQIKQVEAATIRQQQISSWDLMERAAKRLTEHFYSYFSETTLYIAVGGGGNGGDGLAMARMLSEMGFSVAVLTLFDRDRCSGDCGKNFELLPKNISLTSSVDEFIDWIDVGDGGVVIDAILGIGYILRPHTSDLHKLITHINSLDRSLYSVVAIDTPSGMGGDLENVNELVVAADHTFTIYSPKLPMLMPSWGECVGELSIVDINYSESAINQIETNLYFTNDISSKIPKRKKFAHKGNLGSLLVVGSGMFGASIIAARGAEAIGCGVVTVYTPCGYENALYANIPSAISLTYSDQYFAKVPDDIERYSAVCVGMGMGKESSMVGALSELFLKCNAEFVPMVIDADALNLIAQSASLRHLIPEGSILTPHVGEFGRLVGEWSSESDKLVRLSKLSRETNCVVVLKGAYSAIATPSGDIRFNSTGNPSMARAASGDMLAGVIAALLARGMPSDVAAVVGVFVHGRAADRAKAIYGENFVTIERWLSFFCD